jgi:hypothetical protein
MDQGSLIIYGTLLAVAFAVGALAWWGVRNAKQSETDSKTLTTAKLRMLAKDRLLAGPLTWGVWQGRLSVSEQRLWVTDDGDTRITEMVFPAVPQGDVLQHFELDGHRYECIKESLVSGRAWLRNAATQEVVLSSEHAALSTTIYRGRSDTVVCRVGMPGLMSEIATVEISNGDEGRLFTQRECAARVLSLSRPSLSVLERCFVLLSVPGQQ